MASLHCLNHGDILFDIHAKLHFNHLNAHDSGKSGFVFDTTWVDKQFSYARHDEYSNSFTRKTKINLRPPVEDCYILGSSNALICLNARDTHGPAYICNPITREYIMLPLSQGKEILTEFGYSPSTNEYKVVRIYKGIGEVFTLGSGIGCRNVGKVNDVPVWFENRGALVDGVIHWMDKKGTIFSFDLADEKFHELPSLPSRAGWIPCIIISLHVLGDFLCAFYYSGKSWEIWSRKKNKNHQHVFWSEVFSYVNDTNIQLIIFKKSGGLLWYDKNVYRHAREASSPRMLVTSGENVTFFGFPHKNTFVSLKDVVEENTKLVDLGERVKSNRQTESIDR
ncbi:uncharacterized protein LOC113293977 [Papaver somniferum]|uniref:uncharacterized protein LOC113293977 n=1 Tax=Papaver somniferum TaxID=3469 RepID=UPI000E705DD5|nr:uncharacterized protein LOC113293977 [Papaver somniferum]